MNKKEIQAVALFAFPTFTKNVCQIYQLTFIFSLRMNFGFMFTHCEYSFYKSLTYRETSSSKDLEKASSNVENDMHVMELSNLNYNYKTFLYMGH